MYHDIMLLGIVLSILFYELTGFSPAGLVVAGYFALNLQSPARIVYTLVVAFLTWGAAKILSNWIILYGKRRFAVMILLAFVIDLVLHSLGIPAMSNMIGTLIPGIIAQEFERQGVLPSVLSLGIVTLILGLIMMLAGVPVIPVGIL